KFCRVCGMRILMTCIKCGLSVRLVIGCIREFLVFPIGIYEPNLLLGFRPSDKYCPHCGARRWALFEMWRHGILHRSTGFTIFTIASVGVAWLAVYGWIKSKQRYYH